MKPSALGYYILIELEKVEETTDSGIITATREQLEREQKGQHKGKIVSIGPLAFAGYSGVPEKANHIQRAECWGVRIGDVVEMGRYAGTDTIQEDGHDRYMIVPDSKLMCLLERSSNE